MDAIITVLPLRLSELGQPAYAMQVNTAARLLRRILNFLEYLHPLLRDTPEVVSAVHLHLHLQNATMTDDGQHLSQRSM